MSCSAWINPGTALSPACPNLPNVSAAVARTVWSSSCSARINSGIAAAQKRGVVFGNPRLRAGDKEMIKKIVLARDETHVTQLIDTMGTFIPTVLQLRPAKPWPDVAEAVSRATGVTWTVERLMRSVRRLVREGMVDRKVMAKAPRPRRRRSEELALLVQGLALTNPGLSLRGIGGQLEAMKIRTPAGHETWSPASVSHLLAKIPPLDDRKEPA